jgi:hypothetical protein
MQCGYLQGITVYLRILYTKIKSLVVELVWIYMLNSIYPFYNPLQPRSNIILFLSFPQSCLAGAENAVAGLWRSDTIHIDVFKTRAGRNLKVPYIFIMSFCVFFFGFYLRCVFICICISKEIINLFIYYIESTLAGIKKKHYLWNWER